MVDEFHDADDFIHHLVRQQEYVSIVLRKLTHPEQTLQNPRFLIAVHQPDFGPSKRELPITVEPCLVDEQPAGTIHGLDGKIPLVNTGEVHVFAIIIPMAGLFPQCAREDYGCAHLRVIALSMFLAPEVHQGVP